MKFHLLAAFGVCVSVGTQAYVLPASSASTSRTELTFLSAATVELKEPDVTALSASPQDSTDEEENVAFPPPLNQLDRLKRAAVFWSKAVPIVANYYGLIGSLKLQEVLGEELDEETIEVGTTKSDMMNESI